MSRKRYIQPLIFKIGIQSEGLLAGTELSNQSGEEDGANALSKFIDFDEFEDRSSDYNYNLYQWLQHLI